MTQSENDSTTRPAEPSAVVRCEPPADTESVSDPRGEPIVEPDDREEAGYGYGV